MRAATISLTDTSVVSSTLVR